MKMQTMERMEITDFDDGVTPRRKWVAQAGP